MKDLFGITIQKGWVSSQTIKHLRTKRKMSETMDRESIDDGEICNIFILSLSNPIRHYHPLLPTNPRCIIEKVFSNFHTSDAISSTQYFMKSFLRKLSHRDF